MEAKEKAKELVEKFVKYADYLDENLIPDIDYNAKQCALICVDEIMDSLDIDSTVFCDFKDYMAIEKLHDYWQEVQQEIKKL